MRYKKREFRVAQSIARLCFMLRSYDREGCEKNWLRAMEKLKESIIHEAKH